MKSISLRKSKIVSGAISCLLVLSASPMVMPIANAYDVQPICRAISEKNEVAFEREIRNYTNAVGTEELDKPMNERFGWTALHLAVKSGNATMVQSLRNLLVNPNVSDFQGRTPLHYAVLQGDLEIVRILLHNPSGTVKLETPTGAVTYDRPEEYMKKTKLKLTNVKDNLGNTPLHYAILMNNLELAEMLINAGADVNEANNQGLTPLALGIESRNPSGFLRLLLEKDATFGTIPTNHELFIHRKLGSILWDAVHSKNWGTVDKLIDLNLDVNMKDTLDVSIMHHAAEDGQVEIVKKLIQKGADVNVQRGIYETPLIRAAKNEHPEIVKLLIDNGAKLDSRDNLGWTALHYAASNGNLELTKLLIEKGMDPDIEEGGDYGKKRGLNNVPLQLAIIRGRWDVVQELVEKGADTTGNFGFIHDRKPFFYILVDANQWDLLLKLVCEKKCNFTRDMLYTPLRSFIIGCGGETGCRIVEEMEKSLQ